MMVTIETQNNDLIELFIEDNEGLSILKVQGHTFTSLIAYLEWLKQEWYSFEEPLYTLNNYLNFGKFMWLEVYCLKEK